MFKVCQKGIRTKDKGKSFAVIIFSLFLIFAFFNACAVSCIPWDVTSRYAHWTLWLQPFQKDSMFKVRQKGIRTKDKGQSFVAIIFSLFLIFVFFMPVLLAVSHGMLAPDMRIGLDGCILFEKISCSKYVRMVLEPKTKDKALRQ